jgi:hypothetical protein
MRRLALLAVATASLLAGPVLASPAAQAAAPTNSHGDWWCIAVDAIDFGYCQGSPYPEKLPIIDHAVRASAR